MDGGDKDVFVVVDDADVVVDVVVEAAGDVVFVDYGAVVDSDAVAEKVAVVAVKVVVAEKVAVDAGQKITCHHMIDHLFGALAVVVVVDNSVVVVDHDVVVVHLDEGVLVHLVPGDQYAAVAAVD